MARKTLKTAAPKKPAKKKTVRMAVRKLGLVVAAACRRAEETMGGSKGAEKKAWVIKMLNERIDIPFMTEGQEEALLSLLVDVVCDILFNKYKGEINDAEALISELTR